MLFIENFCLIYGNKITGKDNVYLIVLMINFYYTIEQCIIFQFKIYK